MARNDEQERKERAKRIHEQIEDLRKRQKGLPSEDESPKKPSERRKSPRDFIHEKMKESDESSD